MSTNTDNERKWFNTKNPFRIEMESSSSASTSTKPRSKQNPYKFSSSLPITSQNTIDFIGIEKTKTYSSIPETSSAPMCHLQDSHPQTLFKQQQENRETSQQSIHPKVCATSTTPSEFIFPSMKMVNKQHSLHIFSLT